VLTGNSTALNLDLDDREIDSAELLIAEAGKVKTGSAAFMRLALSMKQNGLADAVLDGLSSRDPMVTARSLRISGLMRMEALIPWIGHHLWSADPAVRAAAVRALGRIGGARSADALLVAIQRLGPRPSLVIALARAAPDLYLEVVLQSTLRRSVHPAVALAAGIRRRRTATFALMAQMSRGSRRMRAACSRALGWIGAPVGVDVLNKALSDGDWRVRMSAAKALGSVAAYQPGALLEMCLTDRNPRVQRGARDAMRKLSRPVTALEGGA
jgi:hypothetical protein